MLCKGYVDMASLRIVGIDPATSGVSQLAAQGSDIVLINDIHGSTALNLAATGAGSLLNLYVGGTAAGKNVLQLTDGGAAFNPTSVASYQGVTIAGGDVNSSLVVSSSGAAASPTLVVTHLGLSDAVHVFGVGATALLSIGDGGTFLYNKTGSDMELYTFGLGSTFIQGGSGGTVEMFVEAAISGSGGGAYVTGGAAAAAAASGGPVAILGGSAVNASSGVGGPVTIKGGSSNGSAGGSLTLSGGQTTNAAAVGGDIILIAGVGSVLTDPSKQGAIQIGATQTDAILIGSGAYSTGPKPGAISIKGHSTNALSISGGDASITGGLSSNSGTGGAVGVVGGAATGLSGMGGAVFATGGQSTNKTGGAAYVEGGVAFSAANKGGTVYVRGGDNNASIDHLDRGDVLIGDTNTDVITVGGGSFSDAAVPGTVSVLGHASSGFTGGDLNVTAGNSTSVAGGVNAGLLALEGGASTAGTGGNISIKGGNSASVSKVGGIVAVDAGTGGSTVYAGLGIIAIGFQAANNIVIGGMLNTTPSAGTPGDVEVRGHHVQTVTGLATDRGGSVRITGGNIFVADAKGGDVRINPGAGTVLASAGAIYLLDLEGDTLSIGNGTVVPKVNIRDGRLSFTDTASISDSNPSATSPITVKNTLYALNTVSAWGFFQIPATNSALAIYGGFGLASAIRSGNDLLITFRNAASANWEQVIIPSGWDAAPGTPGYYATPGGFSTAQVRIRLWNWSGSQLTGTALDNKFFFLVRMAREA